MNSLIYEPSRNNFVLSNTFLTSILPQLVWHITDNCQLSCPFCFSTKSGIETDVESIEDKMKLIQMLGVQKIDISGGEPLLHEKLPYICYEILRRGLYITITTSGIGLPKNINWLVNNCNIFSRIILSIDCSCRERHDSLRGQKGVFAKTMRLLKKMKRNGGKIRINTVVSKTLLDDIELNEMMRLIKKINPKEWCLLQPHPANQKSKIMEFRVGNDEFQKLVSKSCGYFYCQKTRVIFRAISHFSKYWVLYPDGKLKRHSESSEDLVEFDFQKEAYFIIRDSILNNGFWIPTEKKNANFKRS